MNTEYRYTFEKGSKKHLALNVIKDVWFATLIEKRINIYLRNMDVATVK
jgi:hypothetical protein